MRKQLLVIAGTICLLPGVAFSADQQNEFYDWTGPYLGVHLGYGKASSDFTDATYNGGAAPYPIVNWDTKSDGAFAGLQGGYNFQNGNIVIGVEGEVGYLGLKGDRMQPGMDPFGIAYDAAGTMDGGGYGALSLRLGHALDKSLFYVKGGVAYSKAKVGFLDTCTAAPCGDGTVDASTDVGWGYQIGGGVEQALSTNWTIKAEYLYFNFGSADILGNQVGGGNNGAPVKIDSDLSAHTIKIGLNYRF